MRWLLRAARVVPLVLALVLAGCAIGGPPGRQTQTRTILGEQVNFRTAETVEDSPVEVEMDDFYFEPTVLQATPGRKLTFELHNEGESAHTFTLAEQQIDNVVQPSQDADVTVTFPESGTVLFRCRFHADAGMRGALTVKPEK